MRRNRSSVFSFVGVTTNDNDEKVMLPVHLILGTNEYAKIKTGARPRVGRSGEPVAEYTKFGWTILSPGTELDLRQHVVNADLLN